MAKRIFIDKKKCISCGLCVSASKNEAIFFDEDNKAEVNLSLITEDDNVLAEVCPSEAIKVCDFDESKKEYIK